MVRNKNKLYSTLLFIEWNCKNLGSLNNSDLSTEIAKLQALRRKADTGNSNISLTGATQPQDSSKYASDRDADYTSRSNLAALRGLRASLQRSSSQKEVQPLDSSSTKHSPHTKRGDDDRYITALQMLVDQLQEHGKLRALLEYAATPHIILDEVARSSDQASQVVKMRAMTLEIEELVSQVSAFFFITTVIFLC